MTQGLVWLCILRYHTENVRYRRIDFMTEGQKTLSSWIRDLPKRGKLFFSQEDVFNAFPEMSPNSIRKALERRLVKGEIQSVWRGFYGVVVYEYGLQAVIPPSSYIDLLMQYLGRNYYVALLTAARQHGSGHQAPQTFMVMVEGSSLRAKEKNGVRLGFYTRKKIPQHYLERVLTKTGYMSISNPELTALDLIVRMRGSGGLNRVVEVLGELAESMDYSDIGDDYFHLNHPAAIQRLGYLLEKELENQVLADSLYRGAKSAGTMFRTTPLVTGRKAITTQDFSFDQKWRVVINEEVEVE